MAKRAREGGTRMREDNNTVKKWLLSIDFSRESPGHREQLRHALRKLTRELSENELDGVAAAGESSIYKNISPEEEI
jgi:hypothetical protein